MVVYRTRLIDKPFHTMTAADACHCLTVADDASPAARGGAWETAFLAAAARLGYLKPPRHLECRCGCRGLLVECGMVRPEIDPAAPMPLAAIIAHVGTAVPNG